MKLVVLCGGKGTRLRSVVSDVPKPLAPVGKSVFLEILLEQYVEAGFDDIILSSGYLADKIEDFVTASKFRKHISVVRESEALGTGGAVRYVIENTPACDALLVVNGDTIVENLPNVKYFNEIISTYDFAIFGRGRVNLGGDRYGQFFINAESELITGSSGNSAFVSYGMYLVRARYYLDHVKPCATINLDAVYEDIIASGNTVKAIELGGTFIDIGVPRDYFRFRKNYENTVR